MDEFKAIPSPISAVIIPTTMARKMARLIRDPIPLPMPTNQAIPAARGRNVDAAIKHHHDIP